MWGQGGEGRMEVSGVGAGRGRWRGGAMGRDIGRVGNYNNTFILLCKTKL